MSTRMERANSEILKALSEILSEKMNNPKLSGMFFSVSEVDTSPDFRHCKAKISCLNLADLQQVIDVLQKSEGFIKRELSKMVSMPQVPIITFVADKSAENEMRVEELLKKINLPKEE